MRPVLMSSVVLILQLVLVVYGYVEAVASNLENEYVHFQPMVAILCGHGKFHNQYFNEQRQWVTDYDSSATCIKDKLEILEYCRKVYPKKDIRNIVDSNRYYRIDNWQPAYGHGHHLSKVNRQHYVKPIRCLEGSFQSDALLVPEHCLFDHIHNNSVCESTSYWNRTASQSCTGKNKILESYAMLLPCGVGIFSGVEFVCCPATNNIIESNSVNIGSDSSSDLYSTKNIEDREQTERSEAIDLLQYTGNDQLTASLPGKPSTVKSETEAKSSRKNKNFVSGISTKIRLDNEKYSNVEENDEDEDEDDTSSYEGDGDDNVESAKDDTETRLNKFGDDDTAIERTLSKTIDKKRKQNKDVKNNDNDDDDDDFYDDEYEEKDDLENGSTSTTTTTTTTTETPLEHYYSHFDAKNEHQQFKMAEKALKNIQSKKMSKIFREYAQFQSRFGEKNSKKGNKKNSKKNKFQKTTDERLTYSTGQEDLDESIRQTMEKRYENTLESLEAQNQNEKQQLNAMHQQRVLTLINMKKQEATDCYTNALNQFPLKIKKIQKCLEKLMKSLEKDRVHTLHHYRHLLLVNPKLATKEKQATLTHLENLIVIANRSISMLNKYPNLNEKIRNHIVAFWHNLRGVSFDQEINRETELAIVDKYEQEILESQQEKQRHKQEQVRKFQEQQEHKTRAENAQRRTLTPDISSGTSSPTAAIKLVPKIINEPLSKHVTKQTVKEAHPSNVEKHAEISHPVEHQQPALVSNLQHSQTHHETGFVISEQKPEAHYLTQVRQSSTTIQPTLVTLAIACAAIVFAIGVGIALYRNGMQQSPLSQGFVAVQQHQPLANPAHSSEAQHVEALQINGYENPTYKYFENNLA